MEKWQFAAGHHKRAYIWEIVLCNFNFPRRSGRGLYDVFMRNMGSVVCNWLTFSNGGRQIGNRA